MHLHSVPTSMIENKFRNNATGTRMITQEYLHYVCPFQCNVQCIYFYCDIYTYFMFNLFIVNNNSNIYNYRMNSSVTKIQFSKYYAKNRLHFMQLLRRPFKIIGINCFKLCIYHIRYKCRFIHSKLLSILCVCVCELINL